MQKIFEPGYKAKANVYYGYCELNLLASDIRDRVNLSQLFPQNFSATPREASDTQSLPPGLVFDQLLTDD